jgi:hypothetical protein
VNERYRSGLREQFARVCAKHDVRFGHYYETADEPDGETESSEGSEASSATPTPQITLPLFADAE